MVNGLTPAIEALYMHTLTIIQYHEQWCHQVTHSLHVPHLQVLPHVRTHDVAQFVQIGRREVPVIPVASLHVLVDTVQVQCHTVQHLRLTRTIFILACYDVGFVL